MSNHDDRDRQVEDFFETHRSRVVEHQADDETWEAISLRAREARTRSRGMWFLGGAAAASAAAVATAFALWGSGPGAQPAAPAGPGQTDVQPSDQGRGGEQPAEPPGTDPPTAQEPTAPEPTPPGETADPGDGTTDGESGDPEPFTLTAPDPDVDVWYVMEPTGDESDLRVAQFEYAPRPTDGLAVGLAVSEDAGKSWDLRVDLGFGDNASVAARDSIWTWGSMGEGPLGMFRSDDRGRTAVWVPTRGLPIGVETFRSTLVVVTAGCEGDEDDSCAEVVITDVTTNDATSGRRMATLEGLSPGGPDLTNGLPLPEGWTPNSGLAPSKALTSSTPRAGLGATYDAVYVSYGNATYRIADGEEVATVVEPPGAGCWIDTAPDSPDGLVSYCWDTDRIFTSADGGSSWEEVATVEGEEVLGLASNDGTHLVLATDRGVHVGVGGQWDRTLDATGEYLVDVRALGGQTFRYGGPYAYGGEFPAFSARWTSDDGGRTWTEQPRIVLP
ncbi:hypothetical protein [Ornithinimicrobium cerasi]|uniref:BNR/Asp-box repeat-containing protein n=1 Tax=Ornithinimicrobium cerasi TaxID=2248773 RepID=A0A285VB75_9MICO|nr:hypothetical protein [Ornithinimicrobium cerasi]SOC51382.1 hypothetical protein SAMN05421879_101171 [Ornithinimicrobium cerasi]